jgi:hypothetical protein
MPIFISFRVAALTEERIYSPDKPQYWQNLVQLMFAGADACDRALREKACAAASWETPVN